METTTVAYKIRDTKTGLYSNGGRGSDWSTEGKAWGSMTRLKLHLSMFNECAYDEDTGGYKHVFRVPEYYKNAEIVKLIVVVKSEPFDTGLTVRDFIEQHNINHDKPIV